MCSSGSVLPRRTGSAAPSPTPTPAQLGAWDAISHGKHALVVAPTGSGKTLSAFLWAIDRIFHEKDAAPAEPQKRRRAAEAPASPTRVLYISPLKALGVDVERNLRSPLVGIGQSARRLGVTVPGVSVGVRSGDTTSSRSPQARDRPARHPHHDARVAVPHAHEPGRRDAQERAHRDRRRGARRRGDQARRPPRGQPRAARRAARAARAAHRALGHGPADRRGRPVPRRLGAGRDRGAALDRRRSTSPSSCRSTTC